MFTFNLVSEVDNFYIIKFSSLSLILFRLYYFCCTNLSNTETRMNQTADSFYT